MLLLVAAPTWRQAASASAASCSYATASRCQAFKRQGARQRSLHTATSSSEQRLPLCLDDHHHHHHLASRTHVPDAPRTTISTCSTSQSSSIRDRAKSALATRDADAPSSPFLRDRHSRQHTYLRISLTERCNLRCLYCMPLEGVPLTPNHNLLSADEVGRIARLFVDQGVNKIRLTGGEPTIRHDLPDIIENLSALRPRGLKQIGITTNGLTIPRHINHLVASGLTHLNVSLDTLDPFKFELMTRRPAKGIEKVLKGIEAALALGVPQVKINVVVVRALNDGQDVLDFVDWVKDKNVIVRFIEYMPFDGNRWRPEKLVPYTDLLQKITEQHGPLQKVQDDANDTSKHWRVPGHKGSIGFITSMTDHFCGTCNRLRVTADGNLKVCLFGNAEVSLRDAMRGGLDGHLASDEELLHIVGAAVKRKHARHAGMSDPIELAKGKNRAMIQIGMQVPSRARGTTAPLLRSNGSLLNVSRKTGGLGTGIFPPTKYSSLQVRPYSSSLDDPWADLDDAADRYIHSTSRSQSEHKAEPDARTSESTAIGRGNSRLGHMGTAQDNESPWADLDVIADSHMSLPASERKNLAAGASMTARSGAHPTENSPIGMAEWDAMAIAAAEAYARSVSQQQGEKGLESSSSNALQQSALSEDPVMKEPHTLEKPTSASRHAALSSHRSQALTHLNPHDASMASMVDVSEKAATMRSAQASCRVHIDDPTLALLEASSGQPGAHSLDEKARLKGPVLHTAQLAGIMGAKRTSELIPLCHGLNLSHVDVHFQLIHASDAEANRGPHSMPPSGARNHIIVTCTATTTAATGVEMEALTGASIASLTIWDMLKSVGGKTMHIDSLVVCAKTGGKSGDFQRQHPVV